MIKIFFLLVIVLISSFNVFALEDKWHAVESTHFILYHKNATTEFVDKVLRRAEYYYDKIADDIGFKRYEFWLGDNRAKIYIYRDMNDYSENTHQPHWSSGYAALKEKTINTYPLAKGFFVRLLPHELGHIIFREFVGFDNRNIPLWLDEGVASFQEKIKRLTAKKYLRKAILNNKFIPLDKLSTIDLFAIKDKEKVDIFYLESVCVVYYLIIEFGKDRFVDFCSQLRDGKTFEQALRSTYRFDNLAALNNDWLRFLKNE